MPDVIIVGAGPAGLFAADVLNSRGLDCMIIEGGREILSRHCPASPDCDCDVCDILEGVGGAGGFSDGKNTYSLTRGTQAEDIFDSSAEKYLAEIDRIMLKHSWPGLVLNETNKRLSILEGTEFHSDTYFLRHVGTDGIQKFIFAYCNELRSRGVEILTNTRVTVVDRKTPDEPWISVAATSDGDVIELICNDIIFATGLQGATWMESVADHLGIPLANGPAGFGIRVEAKEELLEPLFAAFYDFKLTFGNCRSFCCNRAGYVVNENHYPMGIINVNGHSYLKGRRSGMSNFALIQKIDWAGDSQDIVRYVAKSINMATGNATAIQSVKGFMQGYAMHEEDGRDRTNHQARPGLNIGMELPIPIYNSFCDFITELAKIVPKIISDDCYIYAPEIKYYGRKFPVDFKTWAVEDNIYVVGNASGYLDSFVSAALTGIIAANDIVARQGDV